MYNKLLQKYKSGITFFNELAVFFLIHLHTLYNIDQPSNGRNIEFVLTQTQHLYPHIKYSQRTGIHYCCLRTILIFIQRGAGKILALLWFLWFFYILKRTYITLVGKHSSNQIELILFLLKFNNSNDNNMQTAESHMFRLLSDLF